MQPPRSPLRPPSSASPLDRIEAKLDRLEQLLAPLALLDQAPQLIATAVDTLDDQAHGHEARLDARVQGLMSLLERASRPQTLAMLQQGLDVLESLPGLAATAVDSLDATAGPVRLHERFEAALGLLGRATEPVTLRFLDRVVARGRHSTRAESRLGPWGLLKALREPHTQRAVGYLVTLLRSLGEVLDRSDNPHKSLPA